MQIGLNDFQVTLAVGVFGRKLQRQSARLADGQPLISCQREVVDGRDPLRSLSLVDDHAILNVEDPIGERHGSGIVSHRQHGSRWFDGQLFQELHHSHAVLAIERGRRLVGQDHGGSGYQGSRHRHPLLLASAELRGERLCLMQQTDRLQRSLRFHDCIGAFQPAYVERNAYVLLGRERGKQIV